VSIRALLGVAGDDPGFRRIADSVPQEAGGDAALARVSPPLRSYVLAALADDVDSLAASPVLVVTPDDVSARDLARDMRTYLDGRVVRHYPSRGTGYASHVAPPPHLVGLRIAALDALTAWKPDGGEAPPIVVAGAPALAEAVPDASLRPEGFALHKGEEVDTADVAELLIEAGYERVEQVDDRGQFAVRGDIIDVFAATEDRAARIELFGDEIESIRWFSTFTQRSLGETDRIELSPVAELSGEYRETAEIGASLAEDDRPPLSETLPLEHYRPVFEILPADIKVVVTETKAVDAALADLWTDVTAAMHDTDAKRLYVDVGHDIDSRCVIRVDDPVGDGPGHDGPEADIPVMRAQLPASPARSLAEGEGELEKELGAGYRVVVVFEHGGEAERAAYGMQRLRPALADSAARWPRENLVFVSAAIGDGFVAPALKLAVIPYRRLVHRRRSAEAPSSAGLRSAVDLRVGDYVVHADHGIARFAGFETKTIAGVTRDYLELTYKGNDRVFAPTEQLAKISRYLGASDEPELSALGSKRWQNVKARARRAAQEMAGELLNLYAERQTRKGHAFEPDGEWDLAVERSFPYRETADQLETIEAVKADMESDQPMDRLVCGDVGYGKTEVALRAAVKAVAGGKQVMMLAPTTILARQHLGTFTERLSEFPITIEMISGLRKPAEIRDVVARFGEGKVDILIGTHRLLSRDVRARDLGLVIVDEEQRFGVKQKELLRQLKLRVDVLAMSATPIPRTLQMSMAGLRDISVIETPPEGRRPVRTYVGPWDEDLVAKAIDREIDRGGQVFYLHNRVDTLEEVTERLRGLCPRARFVHAHGRMEKADLEKTVLGFMRGEADVLVATTIIESGIDVPQANTLIVERADHLGLAQAYQIRGRVGRGRERAYAYMMYPSAEALTPDAEARLSTLSDHTELGSGFAIAMRDLELRGAGDLLGDEQSGHVAAVGFELYVAMLEDAVAALRALRAGEADSLPDEDAPQVGELRLDVNVDAYLPPDYIEYQEAKIEIHRRIAAATSAGELRGIRDELTDRFGEPPVEVDNLLELQRARILIAAHGARTAEVRSGRLAITPLDFDARTVGRIREKLPDAMYESRTKTLSRRVGNDPAETLASLLELAEAL